ncbi:hypothetical protein HHI36_016747 [Cryptolaemus montrouzieri]|uniref:Uncharacterized protein n=1 Tax=Cryptolaemus montrouzieri TaxID=559131 RepID=A0ABD2NKU9_9CUCU
MNILLDHLFLLAATTITDIPLEISLERPAQETPTLQTAALPFVQPYGNIQTAIANELPNFEIPQNTASSIDPSASTKTPSLYLLSDTDETYEAAETIHRVNKDEISRDIYRRLRKQYKNAIDREIRRTHLEKIKSSANP